MPIANQKSPIKNHFKLSIYAAVLHIIEQVVQAYGSQEAAFEQFPFLIGYNNELAQNGLDGVISDEATAKWRDALLAWEESATEHLPLRALRHAAGLDFDAVTLLLCIGLIEEDGRFGLLFETIQNTPGQRRPTLGLMNAWWSELGEGDEARAAIRRLQELGLIHVANPDAPRLEWALQVPALVWEALRGEQHEAPANWARYHQPSQLATLDDLIITDALQQNLAMIPSLLVSGEAQALIVRGPQHNGRRTALGALARQLGRGMLEITGLNKGDDERWKLLGPLATLLHALPVIVLDLSAGETAEIPRLNGYDGPLGIVLGKQGGVSDSGVERALTLNLEMPEVSGRHRHWQLALGARASNELDEISSRFRMTSGNIRRAAELAPSYAALAGRTNVTLADVQQASRALNRQTLDTLATRVNIFGDWSCLAVSEETLAELYNLESRCRHRERLFTAVGSALGAQLNCGVRALFSGPSGAGKTLAARLLAAVLHKDLYRLDLSAVVNKYIGETEKNLQQIFSRAEELDVILLLDEGDSLLTQRTSVQTSNDRYANLETNYLLQRLESFEGVLIVTTNAGGHIDSAFQRRMDVVVEFRSPEIAERWAIWQMHLPGEHTVSQALLDEVAQRCTLSGGQIRNAVLHASLLALNNGGIVTSAHLESAVQREYRKTGAVCPLRRF